MLRFANCLRTLPRCVLRAALIAANKLQDFLEMGQEYFARAIDQRLAELPSRKIASTDRTAMAHALAGALLSLMSWWVDHGALASPEEMDALYDRIVWSGVTAGSEAPSSGRCQDRPVSLSRSLWVEHDTRECDRDRNTGRGRQSDTRTPPNCSFSTRR